MRNFSSLKHVSQTLTITIVATFISGCSVTKMLTKFTPDPVQQTSEYQKLNARGQDASYALALLRNSFPDFDEASRAAFGDNYAAAEAATILAVSTASTQNQACYRLNQHFAAFRSGHTLVNCFAPTEKVCDIKLHTDGKAIFVSSIGASSQTKWLGARLIAIENTPVEEYLARSNASIPSDSPGHAQWRSADRAAVPGWYNFLGIQSNDAQRCQYQIALPDETIQTINTSITTPNAYQSLQNASWMFPRQDKNASATPRDPERKTSYIYLPHMMDLASIKSGLDAYTISSTKLFAEPIASVWGENILFADVYKQLFSQIEGKGIENLIIDLRHNRGGSLHLGEQFIYYLPNKSDVRNIQTKIRVSALAQNSSDKALDNTNTYSEKPIFGEVQSPTSYFYIPTRPNPFKGKLVALINENTSSAGAFFAALLQDNGYAQLVGQTAGGLGSGPSGYTPSYLPNSGASISIATKQNLRPNRQVGEAGRLIVPDCKVSITPNDALNGQDRQLDAAFALIKFNSTTACEKQ